MTLNLKKKSQWLSSHCVNRLAPSRRTIPTFSDALRHFY